MDEKNEIEDYSNFCSGWEWFACDTEGRIAGFDNGGLRHLPQTVKRDRQVAERLAAYFLEEAPDRGGYSIRDKVEADFGGWERVVDKELFIEFYGGLRARESSLTTLRMFADEKKRRRQSALGFSSCDRTHLRHGWNS
jgi:hypothetical protein